MNVELSNVKLLDLALSKLSFILLRINKNRACIQYDFKTECFNSEACKGYVNSDVRKAIDVLVYCDILYHRL